jgi:Tol biopolymer transport system component
VVAFLKGGQVSTMRPSGDDVQNLVTQKGRAGDLLWSHDGQSLAFTTTRPGHSLVTIYSFADKSLRYLDASTDRDQQPVWSPDDTHLAYLRIPSVSPTMGPAPEREGEPWSIR